MKGSHDNHLKFGRYVWDILYSIRLLPHMLQCQYNVTNIKVHFSFCMPCRLILAPDEGECSTIHPSHFTTGKSHPCPLSGGESGRVDLRACLDALEKRKKPVVPSRN